MHPSCSQPNIKKRIQKLVIKSQKEFHVIYQAWDTVFHYQTKHGEESYKNVTCSRVFLTKFEVFHLVMKHCVKIWYCFSNKIILEKEKLGIWCKNEQFFIWFPNTKYKFPLYFLYELLMSLRSIIANHSLNISKTKHLNQVGIRYKWALNFSVIIIIS